MESLTRRSGLFGPAGSPCPQYSIFTSKLYDALIGTPIQLCRCTNENYYKNIHERNNTNGNAGLECQRFYTSIDVHTKKGVQNRKGEETNVVTNTCTLDVQSVSVQPAFTA